MGSSSQQPSRVFIVDDDAGVLAALTRVLRIHGYEPCPFASAAAFLAAHDPQEAGCLLLDLSLPDMDGIEIQRTLSATGSSRPIIFLTGYGDVRTSVVAMKAGAEDFLEKPVEDEVLLDAVRRAIVRDAKAREESAERDAVRRRVETLTPRERQVLSRVVAGFLNKQIAAELGTVEKTVKVHRARVMQKMQARSVQELVLMTVQLEGNLNR
jgi:FixJ family two-component response regulator